LPGFLDKNRLPAEQVDAIPLLQLMLAKGDERIVSRDAQGCYRFNARFINVGELNTRLDTLEPVYGDVLNSARRPLRALYETVFNHKAFTGRSGGMFAFEGLGSIYWHMVSKLLLAVQENFFAGIDEGADDATCQRLGQLYYRVRDGIGFNKTPAEYGAFPTDPYSHTPKHDGARQPGMTGQVKEEVLSRFGELGVRVARGAVSFQPRLLRSREFVSDTRKFRYLDVEGSWRELILHPGSLAFTWCQVPVVYELTEDGNPGLVIILDSGKEQTLARLQLSSDESAGIFGRSGRIRKLTVRFAADLLFVE
jgi:hypothetical protein